MKEIVLTIKKVLIICPENSCCSIIPETLINNYFKDVKAYSASLNQLAKLIFLPKKFLKKRIVE